MFAAVMIILIAAFWLYHGERHLPGRRAVPEIAGDASMDNAAAAAPLVLEVPANTPTDTEIYIVLEGDTLWSISMRFTGSPYNYPRIAGENRIADADLIFPGQKIRLIKKQAGR